MSALSILKLRQRLRNQPVDYRDITFEELRADLNAWRERVYFAWRNLGPCTTSELAERSGISILMVRPRTTDLYDLGLVDLVPRPPGPSGREGIYRAVALTEVRAAVERANTSSQNWIQAELKRVPNA